MTIHSSEEQDLKASSVSISESALCLTPSSNARTPPRVVDAICYHWTLCQTQAPRLDSHSSYFQARKDMFDRVVLVFSNLSCESLLCFSSWMWCRGVKFLLMIDQNRHVPSLTNSVQWLIRLLHFDLLHSHSSVLITRNLLSNYLRRTEQTTANYGIEERSSLF